MKPRYILILCAVLLAAAPMDASADQVYKVRKGDNLSKIAKRFHVKADGIASANGLESDRLKPGMHLSIPSSPMKTQTSAPRLSTEIERNETPAPAETYGRPDHPESLLAREMKELTDAPVVKQLKELSDGMAGATGVGGIKEKLVKIAHAMLDIPYRFGGSSLLGIDCSGYVQKVFGLLDIVLPRTAREQFRLGKLVGRDDLSIGDLVFFRTYAKFPSHVGIYVGDNRFIHASSTDRKVTIDRMDAPYYLKRFIGGRRLPLVEPVDEI